MLKSTLHRRSNKLIGYRSSTTISPPPYTKLLMHFDGPNNSTVFKDSSKYGHTFTAYGSPIISTAQSMFGGSSLYLQSASFLDSNGAGWNIGAKDFTAECWAYWTSSKNRYCIDASYSTGNGFRVNGWDSFGANIGNAFIGSVNVSRNMWHHIAITRTGGTARFFVNGALIGSISDSTLINIPVLRIGGRIGDNTNEFPGYIDEFRLSVGIARYTAAFMPPDKPFAR